MSKTEESPEGWVRIGVGMNLFFVGLVLALSVFLAVTLANPLGELLGMVGVGALDPVLFRVGIFAVGAVALLILVLRFSPAPIRVNLGTRQVRSLGRPMSFEAIRHVYRMPGGEQSAEFGIQIRLPFAPDVRLPINSRSLTDLVLGELRVLQQVLEQAPIEPDPRVPQRPPLRDELGERTPEQRFEDARGTELMKYRLVSYDKRTLLAELAIAIGDAPEVGSASGARRLGTALAGAVTTPSNTSLPSARQVAQGAASAAAVDYGRGFFGMASGRYRKHRDAVEAWIAAATPSRPPRYSGTTALGVTLIVLGLVLPPVAFGTIANGSSLFGVAIPAGAIVAVLLLFAPATFWGGLLVLWAARLRRYAALKRWLLDLRARGFAVPQPIRSFFGAPHPEGYAATGAIYWLCIAWIAVIITGILLLVINAGNVENYEPQPWMPVVGTLLVIASAPLFYVFVRAVYRQRVPSALAEYDYQVLGAG